MNLSYPLFIRAAVLFLAIGRSSSASGQADRPLKCADVKNGIFYYFNQKSGGQETFIRKGALQKELIPKAKETILWEVTWLNDCSYARPGESYYLQFMITWGLNAHPILTLMDKVSGEVAFKTVEKDNLLRQL